MNPIGAYDDVEMGGLRSDLYRDVPIEAQKRLIAAFPDMRLIWNPVIQQFQCVVREPGHIAETYGLDGPGVMVGWAFIPGNFPPPLEIDRLIRQRRIQQQMATEECQKRGFANMAEYAEHLAEEHVRKQTLEEQARWNDFFGADLETGCVSPTSRLHYAVCGRKPGFSLVKERLPVAPPSLDRAAIPVHRRRREAQKINAALREGAPI